MLTVNDDFLLRLVPHDNLGEGHQILLLHPELPAKHHHLRIRRPHAADGRLQTLGRVAVIAVEKAQIWRRSKPHPMIARTGRGVDIVVDGLDDDIIVLPQEGMYSLLILRLCIVQDDDPLDVLESKGLRHQGFVTATKQVHSHIVKRSNNRNLVHAFPPLGTIKFIYEQFPAAQNARSEPDSPDTAPGR